MIIWLASYPKSGNTWLRSLISGLMYSDDGVFNFNYIKKIKQFPSKEFFQGFTKDLYDIHEVKKYWILAQEKINLDNKVKFLKTHNLNCNIDNYSFSDKNNTLATIYIVRDPRNLVNSISNHFGKSIEESKNFILSPKVISTHKQTYSAGGEVITYIGSWQEHFNFWTKNTENLLLIKYEDLISDPHRELNKIINFLKKFCEVEANENKKQNLINSTSFESLKKMEQQGHFTESVFSKNSSKKIDFFNKGPNNIWKDNLQKDIQEEIELKLKKEMLELGYL
tara:strand:+ start:123 stop:965 length:843 start_codon:yes stop_codon:yes gene_type:complete